MIENIEEKTSEEFEAMAIKMCYSNKKLGLDFEDADWEDGKLTIA